METRDAGFSPWHRTLILDTNMLLLVVVGCYDTSLIERFKRTDRYGVNDWERLGRQLTRHQVLLTTPHILTEVSNLLGQLAEPARTGCRLTLAAMIAGMDERAEPARALVSASSFQKIGLTDTAINHAAGPGVTVMTDDFQLGGILESRGVDVWNLRRLRSQL